MKKIIAWMAAVITAVSLCACADSTPASTQAPETTVETDSAAETVEELTQPAEEETTQAASEPAAAEIAETETDAVKETAKELAAPGIYVHTYEEELDGKNETFSDWLILLEDSTGLLFAQDTLKLTWDSEGITLENGTRGTFEDVGEGKVGVTIDGNTVVYEAGEENMPAEVEEVYLDFLNSRDYSGTYVNGDLKQGADQLILTPQEDGTYLAELSMYRLCQMEGEGNNVDGALEIAFTDPNELTLYAVFYPVKGSYTLRITQSDWELLPEQTDVDGFVRTAKQTQ